MRKIIHTSFVLLAAIPLTAQTFGLQFKGGLPVSGFETQSRTIFSPACADDFRISSSRYSVGAAGELRLPRHFGIEVDAIYRRVHLNGASCGIGPGNAYDFSTRGNSWEFPFLLKYRFLDRPAAPFVSFGPAVRHIGYSGVYHTTENSGAPFVSNPEESHVDAGYSFGAGMDLRVGLVRISPEVRYSKYAATGCDLCAGRSAPLRLAPLELLLGIGF